MLGNIATTVEKKSPSKNTSVYVIPSHVSGSCVAAAYQALETRVTRPSVESISRDSRKTSWQHCLARSRRRLPNHRRAPSSSSPTGSRHRGRARGVRGRRRRRGRRPCGQPHRRGRYCRLSWRGRRYPSCAPGQRACVGRSAPAAPSARRPSAAAWRPAWTPWRGGAWRSRPGREGGAWASCRRGGGSWAAGSACNTRVCLVKEGGVAVSIWRKKRRPGQSSGT